MVNIFNSKTKLDTQAIKQKNKFKTWKELAINLHSETTITIEQITKKRLSKQ